jgi:ABC-2 type transport system permease protein
MSNIFLIAGRELKSYSRSPLGYLAGAAALLIAGLLFVTQALGGTSDKRLSAQVLDQFFFYSSGVLAVLGIVLSIRLIAYDHEHGTLILLRTSPLRDRELVIGKFLAAFLVMFLITALTAYMPALIFVNGKVSLGHIAVGYLGLILLGGVATSIGLFASAVAKNQIIAAVIATAVMITMYLWWSVAKIADPPVKDFIEGLAVHHLRFKDFQNGVLRLENVVYYLAVMFFFLLSATKMMEARRWQ